MQSGPAARDWDGSEPIRDGFPLLAYDGKHQIYDSGWQRFAQEIPVLLANRYVLSLLAASQWRVRLCRLGRQTRVIADGKEWPLPIKLAMI